MSASLAPARLNHRRCAARDSVSLPRKRQKLCHHPNSGGAANFCNPTTPCQPSHLSLLRERSSQESEGGLSASKWFDNANSNVCHSLLEPSGYDDEPPFFISHNNQSGPVDPVEDGFSDAKGFGGYSRQDSEKDDLRDVIDDLTIENKRLKHLLRNRKDHTESQNCDKLFEVRVDGLPSDKKRELEVLLHNFTSNLNVNSGVAARPLSDLSATQKRNVDSGSIGAPIKHIKADSGYASNSNSGQTSATPSNPGRQLAPVSRKSNDKTVKSYLHNIPNGLLPKQSPVMSERARMALVVRRLENLFTGKTAAPGEHSQPLQQQEVSRLAANADMHPATKGHRQEGSREAHILPFDSEVSIERLDSSDSSSINHKSHSTNNRGASTTSTSVGISSSSSGAQSPDQRPTRPLDLDIHRAQVAEENFEYIRHLGLTSLKLDAEDNKEKEDRQGWVYLNLLINMAQLHTINVTPAFIRKSIKMLSAKFELSEDGNQVRWKGRRERTGPIKGIFQDLEMANANSTDEVVSTSTNNTTTGQHERMTTSNTYTPTSASGMCPSNQITRQSSTLVQTLSPAPELYTSKPTLRSPPASSFDYKPILFSGKPLSRPNLAYLDESTDSHSCDDDCSPAVASEQSYTVSDQAAAGTIVFYNTPLFCSDSSGDRPPGNIKRSSWETSEYALGTRARAELDDTSDGDGSYPGAGSSTPVYGPYFEEVGFELPPLASSCGGEEEFRELPASGIGGVVPQDNFVVDVKVARSSQLVDGGAMVGLLGRQQRGFVYRVEAWSKTDLAPARLPPPSYIFLPLLSSSSSGVTGGWDLSANESADTSLEEPAHRHPVFLAHFSTGESSAADEDEQRDGDFSDDLLTSARQNHPTRLAAQRKTLALNSKPMSMDETVGTGSLAATAGNGSESDSGLESDVDESSNYTDSDEDDEDDEDED